MSERVAQAGPRGAMENRVAQLESQVAYLTDRLASLEERLAGAGRDPRALDLEPQPSVLAVADLQAGSIQQWLGLAGRTLVILGGAYLLRALTGAHVVPAHVGVALGLLYGAPWLLLASRAGMRGSHLDAFTHALTTALIGYPLVWEATLRFGVLDPVQSAMLLAALTAGAFVLASTRGLQGLAWVVSFGALVSAIVLSIAMDSWTAYTVLAIGVGVATLWLGYTQGWTMLRWPAAAVANCMVLVVTGRAMVGGSARGALLVQLVMLAAYLGSFAIRTLVIGREVIPFEVVQSIGVLTVAFGGAIALIHSTGANVVPVGIASLLLAAAGYVIAFAFVERRRHVKNFFFYTLLALLFGVVGIALTAGATTGALTYSVVGAGAAVLARRHHRLTLSLQASVYVLAAVFASGLLTAATLAMALPPSAGWGAPAAVPIVALAAIAVVVALPVVRPVERWGVFASIPRLVVVATALWAAAGTAVAVGILLLPESARADAAVAATIRTGILVLATFAAASSARRESGREAGWLVYPLIVLTGCKVLFADFPQGRPETLFAALALYGVALIAAPRLMRQRAVPSAERAGAPEAVAPASSVAHRD